MRVTHHIDAGILHDVQDHHFLAPKLIRPQYSTTGASADIE